jgi:hypothetical protein
MDQRRKEHAGAKDLAGECRTVEGLTAFGNGPLTHYRPDKVRRASASYTTESFKCFDGAHFGAHNEAFASTFHNHRTSKCASRLSG